MQLTILAHLLLAAAIVAAAVVSVCEAQAQLSSADNARSLCLYAANEGTPCDKRDGDGANLTDNLEIKKAIETFGLRGVRIVFAGCANGAFSTHYISGLTPPHAYLISYPFLASQDSQRLADEFGSRYLAPITHELAHIVQSENAGDLATLKQGRASKNIELGADYLSGILFSKTQKSEASNFYQQNLRLVGLYKEPREDEHGTWVQRTRAFRRGAYGSQKNEPFSWQQADTHFRKVVYEEILVSNEERANLSTNKAKQIPMNLLSSCAEVMSLHAQLKAVAGKPLSACRPTSSALELSISDTMQKRYSEKPCFLSQPASPMLRAFSCMQRPAGSEIVCFRPTGKEVIVNHLQDSDLDSASEYMKKITACAGGVQATLDISETLPGLLQGVAKFGFGFARSINPNTFVGDMVHGVAYINEPKKSSGVEAIEYVHMYLPQPLSRLRPGRAEKRIGTWVVEEDEGNESIKALNKAAADRGAQLFFDGFSFSAKKAAGEAPPRVTRDLQVQQWQRKAASAFIDEGWERIPTDSLRDEKGRDFLEQMQEMLEKGDKDNAFDHHVPLSPNFDIFVGRSGPPCTREGQGKFIAYIMATEPDADEPDEIGPISISAVGTERCGIATVATKSYIREVINNAKNEIFNAMRKKNGSSALN